MLEDEKKMENCLNISILHRVLNSTRKIKLRQNHLGMVHVLSVIGNCQS